MKLTKEEMETIIRFDESSQTATVYTCSRAWKTKFRKLAEQNKAFKLIDQDAESVTFEFPKSLITIRSRKVKRELTEEERQKLSERMKQNIANNPSN